MRRSREGPFKGQEESAEVVIATLIEAEIIKDLLTPFAEKFLGPKGRIYCYKETETSCPAREFLEGAPKPAKSSYAASFTRHCNGEFVRGTHHRIWEGHEALWEYKHYETKTRIMHTMEKGNIYVLLFGFGGKKMPSTTSR